MGLTFSSTHPLMHADLQQALANIRAERAFNLEQWLEEKTTMFNDYMRKSGLRACVVSVSGGVDSAVILAMCAHAQKQENSPIEKVLGVAQPIHSTDSIWKRALTLEKFAPIVTVDQSKIHDDLAALVDKAVGIEGNSFAKGQLRSYQRTPVGYYTAQLLTQSGLPCVVMGTGNYDEDGYLCYFCKAGDGVVDVQLIADLHKSEVFHVGRRLHVPSAILDAAPSADLWEGQTDEEEMGISYDFIELYTEYLAKSEEKQQEIRAACSEEGWAEFEVNTKIAQGIHRRNAHKINSPVNLNILPTLSF